MSWYIHPSKQLRDDELPPELVVTNRDGSIEQVYVPEKTATRKVTSFGEVGRCNCSACNWCIDPYDLFCRRCGARFTKTIYERISR